MKAVPSMKVGHTPCEKIALISLRKPTEVSTSAVVSEVLTHLFSVPVQRYEDVGKHLPPLPTQIWTGLEFHLFRTCFSTCARAVAHSLQRGTTGASSRWLACFTQSSCQFVVTPHVFRTPEPRRNITSQLNASRAHSRK